MTDSTNTTAAKHYAMTDAEARWRVQRTQQLLADGLDKFEAICQVRQEARSAPWTVIK